MYQGLPRGATFCCIYSNKRKFNTLHISFLSLSHIFQWTLEALTEIIFHHIFGTIEWILLKCICPVPVQYNFHCALLLLLLHPIAVVNQAPLQQLFSLPVSRSCIAILCISQYGSMRHQHTLLWYLVKSSLCCKKPPWSVRLKYIKAGQLVLYVHICTSAVYQLWRWI